MSELGDESKITSVLLSGRRAIITRADNARFTAIDLSSCYSRVFKVFFFFFHFVVNSKTVCSLLLYGSERFLRFYAN